MPSVAAEIEAEFERIRLISAMVIDPTLLRPSSDHPMAGVPLGPRCYDAVERDSIAKLAPLTLGEAYARYMEDLTHLIEQKATMLRSCF